MVRPEVERVIRAVLELCEAARALSDAIEEVPGFEHHWGDWTVRNFTTV